MIDGDQVIHLSVEWPVVAALEEWTLAARSQVLYIVGPSRITSPTITSLIAAKYATSTLQANIPVISYFCELSRMDLPKNTTPEIQSLIALTYALIRQLVELLPSVLVSGTGLQPRDFEALDGSLDTFGSAVVILKSLLDLSPPVLFCVIDGIEQLDDQSTRACLKDFVDALRGHDTCHQSLTASKRTLKILFTTAGRSRCLLSHLSENEIVFAEQSTAGRRPGKPSPRRRTLSPTAYLQRLETLESVAD